jgi:hypothetical protein
MNHLSIKHSSVKHSSVKHLQSLLQTVVVVAGATMLNACSSGMLQDLSSAATQGSVVELVSVPDIAVPNQSVTFKLEVQIRRNGFDGRVQLDLQDLPQSVSANSITLEPNQDVTSFVLTGLTKVNANASVRLRFAGLELSRSVSLTTAKLVLDLPGGTHAQTLRNISANVDSSAFVAKQIYANFKGSTCQVMVRSLNAGFYVCFNDVIQAGKTYNLIMARDAIPGTASITYFQGPATSVSRQALWDSISGSLKVVSVSRSKIEFNISDAKFVPAKGFGKNLANGDFMLEASTTVTDISNLP